MSKLVKTPKSIASRTRYAILYSLALFPIEGFHESIMQIGVKKAVRIIMNNAKPSIPNVMVKFRKESHSISSIS
jgi:hypothetical protein